MLKNFLCQSYSSPFMLLIIYKNTLRKFKKSPPTPETIYEARTSKLSLYIKCAKH